jgi:hypothetical protein
MSHQFAQASLPPPLNRLHDDQRRSVMTFSGHSENARGLAGQEAQKRSLVIGVENEAAARTEADRKPLRIDAGRCFRGKPAA